MINRVAGFRDRRALLLPIAAVGLAVGLNVSKATAQDVTQIAGCYELSIEGQLPFAMPPRQVELLVEMGTELLEQGRRLVRPKGGPTDGAYYQYSSWRLLRSETVEVVWTTGYVKTVLNLVVSQDSLWGEAVQSTDVKDGLPLPRAPAVLRRIACR